MEISFNNKTVVITGGSNGIGAAAARLYIESGARVIILDIDHVGEQIASRYSDSCRFIKCDLSDAKEVEKAILEIGFTEGIDILVNNAGIQTYGTVVDTTEELWDKTLSVNLKAQFLCAKYAIPFLLNSFEPVIVNVSSVNGIESQANGAAYVTSKAAILGLTKSIAVDFAPKLRCIAVCPGAVNTPMLQTDYNAAENKLQFMSEINGIHLLSRTATAEEVANFILFLSSSLASFATGHYYRVDGGIGIRI